ncbi:MAG TPA: hypothetical protein VGQ37_20590 [Vicinamibacterales bacterium]|jgi:hypothetical protein|nr:hypothetical protein [Vicinamibacterales bacterium]
MLHFVYCRLWNCALFLGLVAVLPAGCATLTPKQEQGAQEISAIVDATARAYSVSTIYVLIGNDTSNIGGTYRRGMITISTGMLLSRHRDSLVAHELAHYLLGHDAPLGASTSLDQRREQERRELDANAKAVEILTRVTGRTQAQSLRLVHDHLATFHRMLAANRSVLPWGHRMPCDEIHDLLSRFPSERAWTSSLECANGTVAAAGTNPARP